MKITRNGDNRKTGKQLLDCKIYVRKNFGVVIASRWYYDFVSENSYLPLCDLLPEEDAKILKEAIVQLDEPVELCTQITNRRQEGFRNVYLRLENSDRTEDGQPLYLITLLDIVDMEQRLEYVEHTIAKYRHFMTLKREYYFEYTLSDNKFVVYKYVNTKSITVVKQDLDEFIKKYENDPSFTKEQDEQLNAFVAHLKNRSHFFEMNFTCTNEDGTFLCGAQGGTFSGDPDMVSGIFNPEQAVSNEVYYLTTAARDAGTGLLNKKAATEYAIDRLKLAGETPCWIIIMDIDDFKNINDSFGHLFGDQVIRFAADTLQAVVGTRGVVGRFGGDEFFVMLDQINTREDLKTLIKTVVKKIAYEYDPKLRITASIGVSQYPTDGTDFGELFGKADKALYIAKEKGKNRHIIYEEDKHGAYTNDSIQNQAVAYAVSKEKRRKALVEMVRNIYTLGAGYVTEHPEVQKDIRDMFDLDGFTVYGDYGRTVLCRSGNYACEAPDTGGELTEESYLALFGKEDVLVQTSTTKFKTQHPGTYQSTKKQEVGATLRCIARKEGVPFAMIHFDVFNRNRKWSDVDIEMLSVIGCSLGSQICAL
ncbi:MAG: GGDEF domain-containing protein [Lachnospiraceae bacterium]|nr:GGDEF domain-containing protein [Lachnospiraceae bacterium]